MVERRLAAIMVVDVVAYSRLMGADEVGTLAALNAHRQELIDLTIAAHHGRLVKTTGDGMLLEFGSVVDAIGCAVAIQRGMLSRNAQVPEMKRIIFRIGVNIGDIIIDGNDIFGDGVNVAARLESLCEPGGVCISRAANEQVRDKLSLSFADLGEHTVKNIARAVGVFGLKAEDIASLPEIPPGQVRFDSAPGVHHLRSGMTISIVGCIALLLGIGGGVTWWLTRGGATVFSQILEQQLITAIAESAPQTSAKYREDTAAAFAKLKQHRALAVAPRAGGTWRTGDWPTREIGEERVLEKCQQYFNEPCALIGADDTVSPLSADGNRPIRDMARIHYTGLFNPERIPAIREKEWQRSEIAGYATAAGPKAVAFHAGGTVSVAIGAPNQRAAEERALNACNNDHTRQDAPGPCYLYAVDNKVVLLLRSTTPITPAPPALPTSPPPSESSSAAAKISPSLSADSAFRVALLDRMAKIAPSQSTMAREGQVAAYQSSGSHKAIAVFPPSSSWRVSGLVNAAVAEERALEGCEARYGEPCVLIAINDVIQGTDREGLRRPMARVEYGGLFDPQQIPVATDALRQRSDVSGYRAKQSAKAAAFHPWGRIFIVNDASTQREAEAKALDECNADPQRNGQSGFCLLYAIGDQVVLPKRLTSPITPELPVVK